ncbi:MAG: DUF111 family protein, partial [Spirochaetaceae bacterium]
SYAAGLIGKAKIKVKKAGKKGLLGLKLEFIYKPDSLNIPMSEMAVKLEHCIFHAGIAGQYAQYARRVLQILSDAEIRAHASMHEHSQSHHHAAPMLHEAQDILVDITGSAFALQSLNVFMESVTCLSPVYTGGGFVTFSHGTFPVPSPAVEQVINACGIPVAAGPVDRELLTPTGVSILSALDCKYEERNTSKTLVRHHGILGAGFGMMKLPGNRPNAVLVHIFDNGDLK